MTSPTLSPLDIAAQFDASSAHAETQWHTGHPDDKEWHHGRHEAFRGAATFLREHGVLRWTNTLPTNDGAYWTRPGPGFPKWIAEVRHDGTRFMLRQPGSVEPLELADLIGRQWCAVPEPPSAGSEGSTPSPANTTILPLPEGVILHNGGQRCDMDVGPCACGAWHREPGRWLKEPFEQEVVVNGTSVKVALQSGFTYADLLHAALAKARYGDPKEWVVTLPDGTPCALSAVIESPPPVLVFVNRTAGVGA